MFRYFWFATLDMWEDEFNRTLKQQLENEKLEMQKRNAHISGLRKAFDTGYLSGRKWLAQFISEADHALDDSISFALQNKTSHVSFDNEQIDYIINYDIKYRMGLNGEVDDADD